LEAKKDGIASDRGVVNCVHNGSKGGGGEVFQVGKGLGKRGKASFYGRGGSGGLGYMNCEGRGKGKKGGVWRLKRKKNRGLVEALP